MLRSPPPPSSWYSSSLLSSFAALRPENSMSGAAPPASGPTEPLRRQSNRFLRTSRVVRNLNAVVHKVNKRPSVSLTASRRWALQQPEPDDNDDDNRLSALSQRLEEILIMEIHRDGYDRQCDSGCSRRTTDFS
jgi:hypothetical protein